MRGVRLPRTMVWPGSTAPTIVVCLQHPKKFESKGAFSAWGALRVTRSREMIPKRRQLTPDRNGDRQRHVGAHVLQTILKRWLFGIRCPRWAAATILSEMIATGRDDDLLLRQR